MALADLRTCVALCRARGVLTEASGGLSLDVAREVAATGVDYLAVGALTHSAPVLDLGVDLRVLLTVDVGNTNTVLGLFDGPELFESYRIKTDPRVTADELALMFRGLLAGHPAPDGVAVCSTVPAVLRELRAMFDRYFADVPTVVVEPGVRTGVPLLYDNPRRSAPTGSSTPSPRTRCYGGPAVVVDFGTSTNFDVVSAQGEFLGGALAPGIEISVDALAARAAQLRKVELVEPRSVIGKTTVEALQSGMLYGFAGQVDGMVRRIAAELGEQAGRDRHRRPVAPGVRRLRDPRPPRARPHAGRPAAGLREERLSRPQAVRGRRRARLASPG